MTTSVIARPANSTEHQRRFAEQFVRTLLCVTAADNGNIQESLEFLRSMYLMPHVQQLSVPGLDKAIVEQVDSMLGRYALPTNACPGN